MTDQPLNCPQCGAPLPGDALDGLCPNCMAKVVFGGQTGGPEATVRVEPASDLEIERAGVLIGRYKLLEQIGEGGFGVVYMAEQVEPVHRKVALKIIKAGMDTKAVVARFEAERQAAALMDHPNIARVLDGGVTQAGRPYFVMELVRGIPITEFCDQRNLDTTERLKLFIQVCKAVQHAHQKGIIHRDLKPSNILVTLHDGEPVPKIIDFGVAKALGQQLTEKTLFTGFLHMVGTPAYMSPEQAELSGLDIDTRSDIYSLGVLLYELLTGVTPFDAETLRNAAIDEVRRMIRETDPPRPSTRLRTLGEKLTDVAKHRHVEAPKLVHLVRGDLDWIVMMCLEKDRRQRYETANGLAMDVQRHLDDEAVVARPRSRLYELHKTVRRHKVGFAAAGAVVAALAIGLSIAVGALIRERAARERAVVAEKEQARQRGRAERATSLEQAQRTLAERAADEANRNLYYSRMRRAHAEWNQGYLTGVQELLSHYGAGSSLETYRNWEWYYINSLIHQGERLFVDGLNPVNAVAWNGSGTALASSGSSGLIRIRGIPDGVTEYWLKGHKGAVQSLDWSAQSGLLASGGDDGVVRLWQVGRAQPVKSLAGHHERVTCLSWSKDGAHLASASTDGTFRVWDVSSGATLKVVSPGHGPISGIAWSPAENKLSVCHYNTWIGVWDPFTGKADWEHGSGSWYGVGFRATCFSLDGQTVYYNGIDHNQKRYDAETGELLGTFPGKTGRDGYALSVSPNGLLGASGGSLGVIHVWETIYPHAIDRQVLLTGHEGDVTSLRWSPTGKWLASSGSDGTVRIWDCRLAGKNRTILERTHGCVLSWAPDNDRLAVAGGPNMQVIDWESHETVWRPQRGQQHTSRIPAIAWSPSGSRLLTSSWDGSVRVWYPSRENAAPLKIEAGNQSQVFGVAWRADERWIAAVCAESAKVWDSESGELLTTLSGSFPPSLKLAWYPADQLAIPHGKEVLLWDPERAEPNLRFRTDSEVTCVGWRPDALVIAAGCRDGSVYAWDIKTGDLLFQKRNHHAAVYEVAWSPEGKRLATGAYEGTLSHIRLLDGNTGETVFSFRNDGDEGIRSISWSRDGRRLAVGQNGLAFVLDASSGYPDHKNKADGMLMANRLIARVQGDPSVDLYSSIVPKAPLERVEFNALVLQWARDFAGRGEPERMASLLDVGAITPGQELELLWILLDTLKSEGHLVEFEGFLERRLRDSPGVAAYWTLRGCLAASRGDWDVAADSFQESDRLSPGDSHVELCLAVTLFKAQRIQDYRQKTAEFLADAERRAEGDFSTRDRACKAALLLPLDGEALQRVSRLADAAVSNHRLRWEVPPAEDYWVHMLRALSDYRRGAYAAALSSSRQCINSEGVVPECSAAAGFILSASYYCLGQLEAARQALERGDRLLASRRSDDIDAIKWGWLNWVIAEHLRAEVVDLMEGRKRAREAATRLVGAPNDSFWSSVDARPLNSRAWGLATSPYPEVRDAEDAIRLARRAVELTGRTNADYLDTLAAAYAEAGEFTRAAEVQLEAIRLLPGEPLYRISDFESRLHLYETGTPYREFFRTANRLHNEGQVKSAELLYRQDLAQRRKALNPGSTNIASALAILSQLLLESNRNEEAEPYAEECVQIRDEKLSDNWLRFNAHSLLGASLMGREKYAEAEQHLIQGYQGMKQREQNIPVQVRQTRLKEALERLVQLYEAWDKPDQAEEWKGRLAEFQSIAN